MVKWKWSEIMSKSGIIVYISGNFSMSGVVPMSAIIVTMSGIVPISGIVVTMLRIVTILPMSGILSASYHYCVRYRSSLLSGIFVTMSCI